jgi:hypothetical protein
MVYGIYSSTYIPAGFSKKLVVVVVVVVTAALPHFSFCCVSVCHAMHAVVFHFSTAVKNILKRKR